MLSKKHREKKMAIVRQQEAYNQRRKHYEEHYMGRSIQEIVGAPEDISISRNGVVSKGIVSAERPYGDLTVYVSRTGRCYHKIPSCGNAGEMIAINVYEALPRGFLACTHCTDQMEFPPPWYGKITAVVMEKKEFGES